MPLSRKEDSTRSNISALLRRILSLQTLWGRAMFCTFPGVSLTKPRVQAGLSFISALVKLGFECFISSFNERFTHRGFEILLHTNLNFEDS
jgi:hypothetical protein